MLGVEYGRLFQLLWPWTAPAWLLWPSLVFRDVGSLSRLEDVAAAFSFAGSTSRKPKHISQSHASIVTGPVLHVTSPFLPFSTYPSSLSSCTPCKHPSMFAELSSFCNLPVQGALVHILSAAKSSLIFLEAVHAVGFPPTDESGRFVSCYCLNFCLSRSVSHHFAYCSPDLTHHPDPEILTPTTSLESIFPHSDSCLTGFGSHHCLRV